MSKRRLHSILISVLLFTACGVEVTAQGTQFSIAASGTGLLPAGGLANRFLRTNGANLGVAWYKPGGSYWSGEFEYFLFDEENRDRLTVRKIATVEGIDKEFVFPLSDIEMKLEVAGASAHIHFPVLTEEFLQAELTAGFGMYRWFGVRGSFSDTLTADTSIAGPPLRVAIINTPEIRQQDWSGGVSMGVAVNVPVIEPLSFEFSARYKLIFGELWPSLVIDLENISGFQIVELKAGVRATF